MPDISAALRARTLLERAGFRATHALGQNFLLNEELLARLIDHAGVGPDDHVLEIGPGPGVMTRLLAQRVGRVTAIEIDRALEPVLSGMLEGVTNAEVLYQDAMKADLSAIIDGPFHVVANLPYYITAEAVLKVLLSGADVRGVSVMVQKEAAERMMSAPGEKSWCQLAAIVQYFGAPRVAEEVPPEMFEPSPHITSAFMVIDIHREKPVRPRDEQMFLRVVAAAFAMRRKTLVNNLKFAFGLSAEAARAIVRFIGADERVRGEALTLEEIAALSDALSDVLSHAPR
jgi:16S rRNA (adenine1518-N6/adenine1519-N6)-dimethyltransferase